MEVIERTIEYTRPDIFRIIPAGDIHVGSVHCAENEIQSELKEANKPNTYIVGMGDYYDAILKDDKRFDIGGLASWVKPGNIIRSQTDKLKEWFEPCKDHIICLLTGNHEETLHMSKQDDITRNLCTDLGVRYGGYSCYILLKFIRGGTEQHNYLIHAWHGAGAAQTDGARLNRLTRLVNDIQADIYLMGHLHAMTQHTPDRLVYRNGKIKSLKLAATITGSWLKAYTQNETPSYAEKKGYKPSRIGCPVICINPNKDDFWIES